VDTQGRLLEVNDAYCRMSGYSRQELLAMRISDLEASETADDTAAHCQKIMAQGQERFQSRHRCKDGTILDVEVSAHYLPAEGRRFAAFLRDITERTPAGEKTLDLLRLIEAVPSCIAIHDKEGNLLYANQRTYDLHGYSADELMALSLHRILAPASKKLMKARMQELFARGEMSFEVEHLKKDATILPLWINVKTATWEGKSVLLSVETDITERKLIEGELERHRRHLEDMVKERTTELEIKNIALQELNAALKVLLKQREDDKKELEERFVMNIRNLVLPFLEQIKKRRVDVGQQPLLDIIETQIHKIASPLLKNIRQFDLTPKELKVAVLVKEGKSTKEIAALLRIASGSIDIHRKNIRKKMGLNNRRANLQSYLQTFEQ
jgi:PAS domain S-box-containing protein